MSLILTSTNTEYEKPEAGSYNARCVSIIDLGTQESNYNGEVKLAHKIMVRWELLGDDNRTTSGKPFIVGERYTFSMHSKATLRRVLESWRGRPFTAEEEAGFDLKNVLGKDCLLNIIHNVSNGKTYANVAAVSAPMKGTNTASLAAETPLVYLSLQDAGKEGFSEALFALPEWIQETIKKSLQWKDVVRTIGAPPAAPKVDMGTSVAFDDEPMPF